MSYSIDDEKKINEASDLFFNNLYDFEKRWVMSRMRGEVVPETLLDATDIDAIFLEKIASETEDLELASFTNRFEVAEFRWLSRACARLQKQEFSV